MLYFATCQLKPPPFHWRNQALIPPMERGGFRLVGLSDMVNAVFCHLPIETPPFHWRNQALIPPMKRGGFALAGSSDMVNAASCDLPIETTPFALAESGPDSANGKGGATLIHHTRTTPRIAVPSPPWEWRYPPAVALEMQFLLD